MLGYQVTLTTANTNYNLLTLVRAIDSAFSDLGDMVVQVEDDGGSQVFLLGGSSLDGTHYGQKLSVGDYSSHFATLLGVNARCDTDAKKLNITVVRQ